MEEEMANYVMDLNKFILQPNVPHQPIHIKLANADTITFQCDDPFEITDIVDDSAAMPKPRKNPFHRPLPPNPANPNGVFKSKDGSGDIHRANTGPAKQGTGGGQRYKTHFRVFGLSSPPFPHPTMDIDPDFIVD
jgi:hypothetical protein